MVCNRPARFLSIGLVFSAVAFAQTDRGTTTGTLSDPAGAVIAGAMIQAKNVATDLVYTAATSATGNCTVAHIAGGALHTHD